MEGLNLKKLNYYSNKYLNFHERSAIWRILNEKNDIERAFNGCKNLVSYMGKLHPKKLQREDIVELEKDLAKLEIALKRIEEFPNFFNFTDEDIDGLNRYYEELSEEVHKIDISRVSWD